MIEYQVEWPNYQPFPYERELAKSEWTSLTGAEVSEQDSRLLIRTAKPISPSVAGRIAFASVISGNGETRETGIARLEKSGLQARYGTTETSRKESNYLTHGIHRYKGKFYPQLARALLNISGVRPGDMVLDPFMGSGTTLLEAWLTGVDSVGFDISPLAHLISRTKVSALAAGHARLVDARDHFLDAAMAVSRRVGVHWSGPGSDDEAGPNRVTAEQLAGAVGRPGAAKELDRWFPRPVIERLFVISEALAAVDDPVARDFFRVCLSDTVRPVSQQEPRDLRTRRRKEPIEDAPVLALLFEKIEQEMAKVRLGEVHVEQEGPTHNPHLADIREIDVPRMLRGLGRPVDAVVSSPPYATALPYVDTDRLSFLVLGLTSPKVRNRLQKELIGTREIAGRDRRALEADMEGNNGLDGLPGDLGAELRHVLHVNRTHDVGFRRRNTPALLYRYFLDMRAAMRKVAELSRPGALTYLVLGDSKTTLGDGTLFPIRTCAHVGAVCEQAGFVLEYSIPITVTTEDLAHSKNAITENQILVLRRV